MRRRVHGLGAEDTPVADLGCDVFMAGTHKWLYGPRGTGVVWATPEAWDELDVTIPPFEQSSFRAWLLGGTPDGPPGLRASPGATTPPSTGGHRARRSTSTRPSGPRR